MSSCHLIQIDSNTCQGQNSEYDASTEPDLTRFDPEL